MNKLISVSHTIQVPIVSQNHLATNVDKLLWVSRNASIVFGTEELTNIIDKDNFSVDFPCSIDRKNYTIVLTGTFTDIENSPQFEGRESPLKNKYIPTTGLNNNWKIVTWLIRSDIQPTMILTLMDESGVIVENTSSEFWNQLRKRVPLTHPLSLIPQY